MKVCLIFLALIVYSFAAEPDEASTSSSLITGVNDDQEVNQEIIQGSHSLQEQDLQFISDGEDLLTQGINEIENPNQNTGRFKSYLKRAFNFSKKALYVAIRDMPTYLVSYLSVDPADKLIQNIYLSSYYLDFAYQWLDSKLDSVENEQDRERLMKFRDLLNSMRAKIDNFNQGMIGTKDQYYKGLPWHKHMY